MNYLTIEELSNKLYEILLNNKYSSTKAKKISEDILVSDVIHKIDYYMSEYVDEIIINDKEYKRYLCWLNLDVEFKHYTYYLKEDLYDDSVETYVKAKKLYEII